MKSLPHSSSTYEKCSKSFVVSFIPTTFSRAGHSRPTVSGVMSTAARRDVVGDDREVGELPATASTTRRAPPAGPGVVRRDHQRRVAPSLPCGSGDFERLVEELWSWCRAGTAPGRRSPRPPYASPRSARPRSAPLGSPCEFCRARCRASPRPPAGKRISARRLLSWSTAPSAVNGVMTGAMDPRMVVGSAAWGFGVMARRS